MTEPLHFLVRCKRCTSIIMQCRCPSPTKVERWEPSCKNCLEIDHGQARDKDQAQEAGNTRARS